MADTLKFLAVVSKERESRYPTILGGLDYEMTNIMSQEEWDAYKRSLIEKWLGPVVGECDFAEAILHVPLASLNGLFAPAIEITEVEAA